MDRPSQRDHECCIRTEYEIFNDHYDDVKQEVDIDMLIDLCGQFTKLADIPMTQEWRDFVLNLPSMSAYTTCSIWMDMMFPSGFIEQTIVDTVITMCDIMQNNSEWPLEYFDRFVTCMTT